MENKSKQVNISEMFFISSTPEVYIRFPTQAKHSSFPSPGFISLLELWAIFLDRKGIIELGLQAAHSPFHLGPYIFYWTKIKAL